MSKRPGFNILEAFNSCDLNEDGIISRDELRRLIESRGFFVSEKEITTLIEKIDKDRDGKISYHEVSLSEILLWWKNLNSVIPVIVFEEDFDEILNSDH